MPRAVEIAARPEVTTLECPWCDAWIRVTKLPDGRVVIAPRKPRAIDSDRRTSL